MNLSDLIDRNAAFAPDKPAIHFARATLTYATLVGAHRRGGARPEIGARRRARRPRRDPQPQSSRLSGAALRLRAARRAAGAAQLAARGAGAGVHPHRRVGEGAGGGAGLCAGHRAAESRAAGRTGRRPRFRAGGQVVRRSAARRQRRRPQPACRSHQPAADRLHLRHDRPAEGRGAAPGGAGLERRDEPARA